MEISVKLPEKITAHIKKPYDKFINETLVVELYREGLFTLRQAAEILGVSLKDIEVFADDRGKPAVRLYGRASAVLSELGIGAVHLSLSHTGNYAAAMVVLEKI